MTSATTTRSDLSRYGRLSLDLGGIPPGSRLFLGLSGGLDSVYVAWRLLAAGYRLHMLHVEYRTRQRRWPKEDAAYRAVLDWLAHQGLTNWTIQSGMSVEIGRLGYKYQDLDFMAWAFGMMLKAPHLSDIAHVVFGSCREDSSNPEKWRKIKTLLETTAERPLKIVQPKKRYSKAEFIHDMPPDLFRLCWYCREPRGDEPCHKCHTCKLVDNAIRGVKAVFEAKVIYPFRCKYTKIRYEVGDTYRHESEGRMRFLATQPKPRVEWPPKREEEPVDIEKLGYRELQKLAKERGVKASGTREEILTALKGS